VQRGHHHVDAAGRHDSNGRSRSATSTRARSPSRCRANPTSCIGRNPHGPEFGDYGLLHVRYGKAKKGSPPKRRSVVTVWPWTAEILEEWISEFRTMLAIDGTPALWPSEHGPRIGLQRMNSRFTAYRDALGLDPAPGHPQPGTNQPAAAVDGDPSTAHR
jgi:hypothetical protein